MILDEVAAYLAAQGLGTVKTTGNDPAWPIHTSGLFPGTTAHPDDAIGLIEGVGTEPINEMGAAVGTVAADRPALVVQVRSATYASAKAKAEAVRAKLHKYAGTLSGVAYYLILARHPPFPVGRDDRGCWIVGCNYDVTKELS